MPQYPKRNFTELEIKTALRQSNNSIRGAARLLSCCQETVKKNIEKYGIKIETGHKETKLRTKKKVVTTDVKRLIHLAFIECGSYQIEDIIFSLGEIAPVAVQEKLKYNEVVKLLAEYREKKFKGKMKEAMGV